MRTQLIRRFGLFVAGLVVASLAGCYHHYGYPYGGGPVVVVQGHGHHHHHWY